MNLPRSSACPLTAKNGYESHSETWLSNGNCLICYRTAFNATAAASTDVGVDTARTFLDLYFEVTFSAFDGFNIGIRDDFYIEMPADLDQFW